MSPVVFRLPVMCRSEDSTEAGGFALGALALNSLCLGAAGAEDDGAAVLDVSASDLGAGSLILLLENIVCSLDKDHWIYSLATDTDFVMQVDTSRPS